MSKAGLIDETEKPLFSLHALRHAFVSLLIAQDLNIYRVSRIVGHANIQTTANTYGHLFPEDDIALRAIDDVASGIEMKIRTPTLIGV